MGSLSPRRRPYRGGMNRQSRARIRGAIVLLFAWLLAPAAAADLVVRYHRPDSRYEGWNLWVWPEGGQGATRRFTYVDEFGAVARIPVPDGV